MAGPDARPDGSDSPDGAAQPVAAPPDGPESDGHESGAIVIPIHPAAGVDGRAVAAPIPNSLDVFLS